MAKIVLVAPDIPGNTGSIGRTCVALGLELILIHPISFDLSEKSVRRAGLDYWKHVNLKEYSDFKEFIQHENPKLKDLHFFSKTSERTYFDAKFDDNSYLIFGSETKGLPEEIFKEYAEYFYALPMYSDNVRSLNLSNVATAVAYELIRQTKF